MKSKSFFLLFVIFELAVAKFEDPLTLEIKDNGRKLLWIPGGQAIPGPEDDEARKKTNLAPRTTKRGKRPGIVKSKNLSILYSNEDREDGLFYCRNNEIFRRFCKYMEYILKCGELFLY